MSDLAAQRLAAWVGIGREQAADFIASQIAPLIRKQERERMSFVGPDGNLWIEGDPDYDGEICEGCERPVARCIGSWWQAPDDLWVEIVGDKGGVLCPPCFQMLCREKGRSIHFRAVLDTPEEI